MFEKQQTRVHGFYEMYTYLSLYQKECEEVLDQTQKSQKEAAA